VRLPVTRAPLNDVSVSTTTPHRPTSCAEVTPVLLDHGVVAAFGAAFAGGDFVGADGAGGFGFLRLLHGDDVVAQLAAGVGVVEHDFHRVHREAFGVEDAEHVVAVHHEPGDVGHR